MVFKKEFCEKCMGDYNPECSSCYGTGYFDKEISNSKKKCETKHSTLKIYFFSLTA